MVPEGHTSPCHAGEQGIVGHPMARHPLEAVKNVELRSRTRQPIQVPVTIGLPDLRHDRPATLQGIVKGDHDLSKCAGRLCAPCPKDG